MYFSAKLLFETRPLAHSDSALSIEERIVLLDSADESAAAEEAASIGKTEEFTYEASDGGMVIVKFLGIRNLYRLIDDTIRHGTEVYSESHFESNE